MAIVSADWTVTQATKVIDYIGDDHNGVSPTYATILELHRWLQLLGTGDSVVGDDEIAIFYENPSDKSFDNLIRLLNGYTITDAAAEHLYDGSIIQGSGGTLKIWDGIVNFGNPDVQIQIIQNGVVLADDWWNVAGAGLNPDATQGISHRFILKVTENGSDIDGRRLVGTSRTFGKTYSEFPINGGTNRGNNTLALRDSNDNNNNTVEATVATWTTIALTEGFRQIDISGDGTPEDYCGEWDLAAHTQNDFYERSKWLTRDGSTSTLYGLNGELFRGITHEIDISAGSGTWVQPESVSWAGGTGQLLAVDNVAGASTTKMWIQLLTGVAPNNEVITGNGLATGTSGTVVERPISTPFAGQSTGNAILGAYGVGFNADDLGKDDRVVDLLDTNIAPPNNVTLTISNLETGESRVIVAPWDGVTLDSEGNPTIHMSQLSLDVALTGAAETTVDVTSIPSDTPSTGFIVVQLASGLYRALAYSGWSGSVFTLLSPADFTSDTAAINNNVWIAYLNETATGSTASYTAVYSADRNLVVKVRNSTPGSETKEFITSAVFGSSNSTINNIITSDV